MANSQLTIDMITNKSLEVFENNLVITRNVNRQYDDSFANSGAKIGSELRIRLPDRALVTDGALMEGHDDVEQFTTLSVSSRKKTTLVFSSDELTLSLDDFTERKIAPRLSQLASSVDADVMNAFKYIGCSTGTPGSSPSTALVLLQGHQKLNENAVALSPRYATVNPSANASLVNGLSGFFNPSNTISRQFKSGMMGEGVLGYEEVNMSQSVKMFTCGTRTATGGTLSASVTTQGATTIAITGAGASATVKEGDVFTVAGCFAANPQTRESTGSLYQFVAKADVTLDGSGAGNITVDPMYSDSHVLAMMNSLPASGAAVVFVGAAGGTFPQNLIYHKDAITFATADLVLPRGLDMAHRAVHNGISMRILRDYSFNNDVLACRVDVLYGWAVLRKEAACRLWG